MNYILVGLGGGIGAIFRYFISMLPFKAAFPVATLLTNLTGALLIGLISGIAAQKNASENTILFLKTGVCGGYTTFSTFSLEAYTLLQSGDILGGVLYVVLSVAGCIAGVWIGKSII